MSRLPSLFVSHGAPTFALEPGRAGESLHGLGQSLPKPRAIAMVSAHWVSDTPRVSITPTPRTIHDFGGFPEALYRIRYPAPGAPEIAARALALLSEAGFAAQTDGARGLDHGAWVPLLHLYPAADIPVFQISIPATMTGAEAMRYGAALAPLTEEDVLIVGSGGLVHNLYDLRPEGSPPPAYAEPFAQWVRQAIATGDAKRLADTLDAAPQARMAHPTAEHFLPLPVAAGVHGLAKTTHIPGGYTFGGISMDAFLFETA